ncbi:periplasmic protein involved in polysaccharide export [Bernardetia litoralis DSM 6794]|uniref:Periplasmic protein involved in polysaccharide export n=1 Tax=Bernardetia litoralis (strain ATCC 23117 / DSM 6794 / NBRC 15988 / NCIMB 1366 / Fx l1 / Sio-4) TaxID=880071 RepID=I4AFQ9_BERLS|nr:polysaccharide biosynthesis/export family protein [Bernardetia litoralis]AFM02794.1 periplasmic protein involved in polysaccharide export [Bernardetia litoralis DSM 6794]
MRNIIVFSTKIVFCFLLLSSLFSCAGYQNNILFRTGEDFDNSAFDEVKAKAEQNYRLAPFDYITIQVFTNDGEIIIDPSGDFSEEITDGGGVITHNQNQFETDVSGIPIATGNTGVGGTGRVGGFLRRYLIQETGQILLPMIGKTQLAGLTLYQADSLLTKKFSKFYEEPYIITRYINKRVVVMGAMGNKVITLTNENMTLLEVLTLAGNFDNNTRANKIRLIRNASTGNPVMKNIDLSTWQGLKNAELIIQPNDVVYVEPRRRVGSEFLTDFAQVASAIGSSVTLILTILLLQDRFGE